MRILHGVKIITFENFTIFDFQTELRLSGPGWKLIAAKRRPSPMLGIAGTSCMTPGRIFIILTIKFTFVFYRVV